MLDGYHAYWDATVAAQRGNPDPALFEGVTGEAETEQELRQAANYEEWGISREGEPTITDVAVEVDGDGAVVHACVDHTEWVVPEAEPDDIGIVPTTLRLEQRDGAWLMMEHVEPPADPTC